MGDQGCGGPLLRIQRAPERAALSPWLARASLGRVPQQHGAHQEGEAQASARSEALLIANRAVLIRCAALSFLR